MSSAARSRPDGLHFPRVEEVDVSAASHSIKRSLIVMTFDSIQTEEAGLMLIKWILNENAIAV